MVATGLRPTIAGHGSAYGYGYGYGYGCGEAPTVQAATNGHTPGEGFPIAEVVDSDAQRGRISRIFRSSSS
jgi:hypothetical protein